MTVLSSRWGACLLLVALALPASSAMAQPPEPPSPSATSVPVAESPRWRRLLQVSSIDRMLRELPSYFSIGLQRTKAQGFSLPSEVESALTDAARAVFDHSALQQLAVDHLQASLSEAELNDWLEFYESPLGRLLSTADERTASPDFQRQVLARAPQIIASVSQNAGRMALLQSLLQATDEVEQGTRMAMQSQLALEWGLLSTLPPTAAKPSFEQLSQALEGQRFAMQTQVSQIALARLALAYDAFSDEELGQLLRQVNTPAGQAFYIDFSHRLIKSLTVLSERIGQTAGRRLNQRPA